MFLRAGDVVPACHSLHDTIGDTAIDPRRKAALLSVVVPNDEVADATRCAIGATYRPQNELESSWSGPEMLWGLKGRGPLGSEVSLWPPRPRHSFLDDWHAWSVIKAPQNSSCLLCALLVAHKTLVLLPSKRCFRGGGVTLLGQTQDTRVAVDLYRCLTDFRGACCSRRLNTSYRPTTSIEQRSPWLSSGVPRSCRGMSVAPPLLGGCQGLHERRQYSLYSLIFILDIFFTGRLFITMVCVIPRRRRPATLETI